MELSTAFLAALPLVHAGAVVLAQYRAAYPSVLVINDTSVPGGYAAPAKSAVTILMLGAR